MEFEYSTKEILLGEEPVLYRPSQETLQFLREMDARIHYVPFPKGFSEFFSRASVLGPPGSASYYYEYGRTLTEFMRELYSDGIWFLRGTTCNLGSNFDVQLQEGPFKSFGILEVLKRGWDKVVPSFWVRRFNPESDFHKRENDINYVLEQAREDAELYRTAQITVEALREFNPFPIILVYPQDALESDGKSIMTRLSTAVVPEDAISSLILLDCPTF